MSTSALPEEPALALSEGERLLYTFTAPSRTMADLRRSTSWWAPWLLISVVSIAFSFAVDRKIGWEQIVETQIQNNPKAVAQMEKLPADQREKMMNIQVTAARVISYGIPVVMLLTIVVVAAALIVLFNFGFGAKLSYRQLLAVTTYSFLPGILNTALIAIVMFSVQPDAFDIRNPVATNPGYLVPASQPFLKGMLSSIDIFNLWMILLMATGVSQLSKVEKGTAFTAILFLLLAYKLITVGLGSM
jgi:hypothetical protein